MWVFILIDRLLRDFLSSLRSHPESDCSDVQAQLIGVRQCSLVQGGVLGCSQVACMEKSWVWPHRVQDAKPVHMLVHLSLISPPPGPRVPLNVYWSLFT